MFLTFCLFKRSRDDEGLCLFFSHLDICCEMMATFGPGGGNNVGRSFCKNCILCILTALQHSFGKHIALYLKCIQHQHWAIQVRNASLNRYTVVYIRRNNEWPTNLECMCVNLLGSRVCTVCTISRSHCSGLKLVSDSIEVNFLDKIRTKVLRVFLLLITVTSTALPWDFCFFNHATSYIFCVLVTYTVKEKEGKYDREPYPFFLS